MAPLAAVLPGGFAYLVGRELDDFQTESKNLMPAGAGKTHATGKDRTNLIDDLGDHRPTIAWAHCRLF